MGLVISYIRGLGGNESLGMKQLTLKVTALLGILTAQRVSSLTSLCLSHTHVLQDRVILVPAKLGKHHRQGRKIRKVTIKAYPGDSSVCAVETLKFYMKVRESVAEGDQLLVTHRKPHRPASRDTIARWLKQVLLLAGVKPGVFGAHSYRGASTSAARRACITVQKILKRGQWSTEETWRRHYDLKREGFDSDEEDEVTEPLLDFLVEENDPVSKDI